MTSWPYALCNKFPAARRGSMQNPMHYEIYALICYALWASRLYLYRWFRTLGCEKRGCEKIIRTKTRLTSDDDSAHPIHQPRFPDIVKHIDVAFGDKNRAWSVSEHERKVLICEWQGIANLLSLTPPRITASGNRRVAGFPGRVPSSIYRTRLW